MTTFTDSGDGDGDSFTDTFTGIRPADVPWFIAAQLVGAVLAAVFSRWLFSQKTPAGPGAPS